MWAQVVVTFIIFSFIYMVFELFARRSERKMLIEKIVEIGKADVGRYLNEYLGNTGMANIFRMRSHGSIRGALLMLGIGIGVMAGFFINYLLVGDAYLTSNRHGDVEGFVLSDKVKIFLSHPFVSVQHEQDIIHRFRTHIRRTHHHIRQCVACLVNTRRIHENDLIILFRQYP